MNAKRILKSSLSAVLAAGMLTGCSSTASTKSSASEEEKITAKITVWGPSEDQSEATGNWLKKETEAFAAEHPNWDLTFEYGVCAEGDAGTLVATDPEAAADVYLYANDQIPTLTKANALAELGGTAVENIKANNSDSMVNSVTYNGSVYGVPFTPNTWFMYYDTRVFSESDVKNLDTMLEKGKVGFPITNTWYLASFYAGNGVTFFGEDGTDNAAGIDATGDKAVDVTNYLVDLVANKNFVDYSSLTPSALTDGTVNAMFSGSWDYDAVVEAIGKENVGIVAAPTYTLNGKDVQLKAFAGSKCIGVNPNCKYQQVAVALAQYLGAESAQKDHFEMRNILPTISSVNVGDSILAKASLATVEKASIVQPLVDNMANYFSNGGSLGEELAKGTITHDNAKEKTEAWNTAINTASVK